MITEALTNTTNAPITVRYVIVPSAYGCTGPSFNYDVTVNPTPVVNSAATNPSLCNNTAQNYLITSSVSIATFSWSRAAVAGISNAAISGQTSSSIAETLINTSNLPVAVRYIIVPSAYGCNGPAFNYDVTVNPTATVTSAATNPSWCNNTAQNYAITSNVVGATFSWSRALVTGISNAAVSGQTSSSITETLVNTSNAPITVHYVIVPSAYGCPGTPFDHYITVNLHRL